MAAASRKCRNQNGIVKSERSMVMFLSKILEEKISSSVIKRCIKTLANNFQTRPKHSKAIETNCKME